MGKANLTNKISHIDRFIYSLNAFECLSNYGNVIVCEASEFNWKNFINKKNLTFVHSKIDNYKSRGEAEIEILKNSIPYLIKDDEFICKITSKFVPIIKYDFLKLNKEFQIYGLVTGKLFKPQVDSRFLIMSQKFFIEDFINLKKNINDNNNETLERVLFTHIHYKKIKFKPFNFNLFGKNGYDGRLIYGNKFKSFFWYFFSSIRLKLNI